jgi:translocator protein
MDVAAWLVWRKTGFSGAGLALVLIVVRLVLNVLWSYLFLGLHRPDVAFADIEALWTAILIIMILFWREDRGAGGLMVSYAVWGALASCPNFPFMAAESGSLAGLAP